MILLTSLTGLNLTFMEAKRVGWVKRHR